MKKTILLTIIVFMLFACNESKQNFLQQEDQIAIPIKDRSKSGYAVYTFKIECGHKSSDCGNSCITIGKDSFHADCTGDGTACSKTFNMILTQVEYADYYTATTLNEYDLTDEDFFLMPDRSLFVEKGVWLNIPKQLVHSDPITGLFTFTGLFFSATPYYKNSKTDASNF